MPVGLHWLNTGAPPIDALEREWLLAACASPMSVFVIEAADPGRSLDIRDLLTGRRFHVLEQQARRSAPIDALLAPFDTGPDADRPARREARQAMRRALGLEGGAETRRHAWSS